MRGQRLTCALKPDASDGVFVAERIMEFCNKRLDYDHAYYYCGFRKDEDETCNFLC